MKHIIFLDGDGTLWYPAKTKRGDVTHWIYLDPETKDNYLSHMELCPHVYETVAGLYAYGFTLVLISMSPKPQAEAREEHRQKLEHFNLFPFFEEWYAAPDKDPEGKARIMKTVLEEHNLSVTNATMVGDSIKYDYQPAVDMGMESYLIESDMAPDADNAKRDTSQLNTISEVHDLITKWDLRIPLTDSEHSLTSDG